MLIIEKINYVCYLLKIIPYYLYNKISYIKKDKTLLINIESINLLKILNFLKNHWFLQYKTLIGITATDNLNKDKRFSIYYFLLSYKLNHRIILVLNISEKKIIDSSTFIYKGANWYEREIWDLFGIFFKNHPDLRRILTDYGFEGFPLRKDFPQSGFTEIRYDDEKKHVLYESLELTQEYRSFTYITPWSQLK